MTRKAEIAERIESLLNEHGERHYSEIVSAFGYGSHKAPELARTLHQLLRAGVVETTRVGVYRLASANRKGTES